MRTWSVLLTVTLAGSCKQWTGPAVAPAVSYGVLDAVAFFLKTGCRRDNVMAVVVWDPASFPGVIANRFDQEWPRVRWPVEAQDPNLQTVMCLEKSEVEALPDCDTQPSTTLDYSPEIFNSLGEINVVTTPYWYTGRATRTLSLNIIPESLIRTALGEFNKWEMSDRAECLDRLRYDYTGDIENFPACNSPQPPLMHYSPRLPPSYNVMSSEWAANNLRALAWYQTGYYFYLTWHTSNPQWLRSALIPKVREARYQLSGYENDSSKYYNMTATRMEIDRHWVVKMTCSDTAHVRVDYSVNGRTFTDTFCLLQYTCVEEPVHADTSVGVADADWLWEYRDASLPPSPLTFSPRDFMRHLYMKDYTLDPNDRPFYFDGRWFVWDYLMKIPVDWRQRNNRDMQFKTVSVLFYGWWPLELFFPPDINWDQRVRHEKVWDRWECMHALTLNNWFANNFDHEMMLHECGFRPDRYARGDRKSILEVRRDVK
ncbi:MAG: uncharacterized protein KVP18_000915 [Porospora cf. gigantea A]|uniref:uncharacterized protein n=1 Tax=Porospora cf. gigantea A TaxID=2853593 RepID=UPI00355AC80E|nr:MAG: hypothetical protein KVP18_000915 [Porospora cf. gigantea A]